MDDASSVDDACDAPVMMAGERIWLACVESLASASDVEEADVETSLFALERAFEVLRRLLGRRSPPALLVAGAARCCVGIAGRGRAREAHGKRRGGDMGDHHACRCGFNASRAASPPTRSALGSFFATEPSRRFPPKG